MGARCRSDFAGRYGRTIINAYQYSDICANGASDSDINDGTYSNVNGDLNPGASSDRNANRNSATDRNSNRYPTTNRNDDRYTATDRSADRNTPANGDTYRCANAGRNSYVLALGMWPTTPYGQSLRGGSMDSKGCFPQTANR